MLNQITLTVDGVQIGAKPGQTVIQAAMDAGIYVPYLCYWPGMKPYGACRVCVVEVEGAPGVTIAATEDTFLKQGIAELIEKLMDNMTNSVDGSLKRKGDTFQTQIDLQNDRIVQFDKILDNKRLKLQRQFLAMEQALALLSSQSQVLGSLTSIFG